MAGGVLLSDDRLVAAVRRDVMTALAFALADAAMPFFIVHQPVILGVAHWVVRWDAGIETKWLAIFVVSFAVSAAVAIGLARAPVLSSAFGVKHRVQAG